MPHPNMKENTRFTARNYHLLSKDDLEQESENKNGARHLGERAGLI
ncbi:hypothetical protein PO124_27910 [Bacillus licheniformis]|nr:hypothetical protein [Bacillus licheniformis]